MTEWSAVNNLLSNFAWGLDTMSPDRVLACYWPDARYSVTTVDGGVYGPYQGHDEIREHLEGSIGVQTDVRRHVITNVRVGAEVDGRSEVGAYLSLMITEQQVLSAKATGVYAFTLREQDGEVRIEESNVTLDGGF